MITHYFESKDGKRINMDTIVPVFWGLTTALSILGAVYVFIPILFQVEIPSNIVYTYGPMILGVLVMSLIIFRRQEKLKYATRVDEYRCDACGSRWITRNGKPIPEE